MTRTTQPPPHFHLSSSSSSLLKHSAAIWHFPDSKTFETRLLKSVWSASEQDKWLKVPAGKLGPRLRNGQNWKQKASDRPSPRSSLSFNWVQTCGRTPEPKCGDRNLAPLPEPAWFSPFSESVLIFISGRVHLSLERLDFSRKPTALSFSSV